jgi:hypothetical protein
MRSKVILSIFILILGACYEKQEGCLDFRASNYSFSADEPCEDCCTFPKLRLSVKHEWGDTTLMSDSIYLTQSDQYVQILESKFYITDLRLTILDEEATVSEVISAKDLEGNSIEVSAANALVQTSRFNYDLGTFEESTTYERIKFNVGVDGEYLSENISTDVEMFDDSTYVYTNFRMEVILDQIARDTIIFELTGKELVEQIEIDGTIDVPLGVDYSIPIVANYQVLLENVDLKNLNSTAERKKVKENLKRFFNIE